MSNQQRPERRHGSPGESETPERALAISLLALAASAAIGLRWPQAVVEVPGLVWLLALVPVLLWAHARGWRGAAASSAGAMIALTLYELLLRRWLHLDSAWLVLGAGIAVFIPLTLAGGWLSDLVVLRIRDHRLYELSPVPMLIHARDRIVFANLRARELLGVERGSGLKDRSLLELAHPDDRDRLEQRLEEISVHDVPRLPEDERFRLIRPEGGQRIVEMASVPVVYGRGRMSQTLIRDITELARSERKLVRRAFYDGLTALPNRQLLHDRLEQATRRAQRRGGNVAVLFADLDDFKAVNDRFGHAVGDEVLIQTARRMQSVVRREDTVARYGGDEFAVLLEGLEGEAEASLAARRLVDAFREPVTTDRGRFSVGLSVGIALRPDGMEDVRELIERADAAMFRAKKAGGDGFRVAGPEDAGTLAPDGGGRPAG
jgi:diguanylate cyclase (GGDEF)-like protein/PAS domain S-box-containing protein